MNSEFLLITNYTDELYPTRVAKINELIGSVINMKTIGNTSRKIFNTNVDDNARVYTYNQKSKEIELDKIVAIEEVSGDIRDYSVSSYKTTSTISSQFDRIAAVDKSTRYKISFVDPSQILQNKKIALVQIEDYILKANVEDFDVVLPNNTEIQLNYDMGMIIGSWCVCGSTNPNTDGLISWKFKDKEYMESIYNIALDMFGGDQVSIHTNKWGDSFITISDIDFSAWMLSVHGDGPDRTLPNIYYSAPVEFIDGFIFGVMLGAGRYMYNDNKKILYYTVSSISAMVIVQLSELINLYRNIPTSISTFNISSSNTQLHILNIRVTDETIDSLPIEYFIEDIKQEYVPKSSKLYLKNMDHVLVINSNRVKELTGCEKAYIIYLENGNNIIGLNGMMHSAKRLVL